MIRLYYSISIAILLCLSLNYAQNNLPYESSTLFSGSGNCQTCHEASQFDSTSLRWNGNDVSPVTYWRSTMMGNSSKDPYWRAQVANEVHFLPSLKDTIESTCTKCHAPMGFTQAIYDGASHYSMDSLKIDRLANDGVSCTVCHQIKQDNFGSEQSYSGNYHITNERNIYGPYEDPDTFYMWGFVDYGVSYGPHINQSELCASCHNLFTPTFDNEGNVKGTFPEQTVHLEWKNSIYPAQNIQCQDCHMAKIYDPMIITTIPSGYSVERTPYWLHSFVGGNSYMLKLLKNNIDTLGLTAEPEHFDSTIASVENLLTKKAVDISSESWTENDSIVIRVKIENKAGHKLPTGIPFRRMWVHLKVETSGNETIFESGKWDDKGYLVDYNSGYEPHYQTITAEDQVQVYESVFAGLDEVPTFKLMRAEKFLKDNRIPPKGFSSSHNSYDSTQVYGNALNDPDFNKDGSTEGTGSDFITYKFPEPANKNINATIELCYQSIKPQSIDSLRTVNEPDINSFVDMYDALPNLPFIIKSETISIVTDVADKKDMPDEFKLYQNYPNPFNPATNIIFSISSKQMVSLKVYNSLGEVVANLVNEERDAGNYSVIFNGTELSSGIYFYRFETPNFVKIRKMVLLK